MATSGSKSVALTSWDTLKFSWTATSQSVENNTTTVSWKMELVSGSSGQIVSSTSKAWEVTVNGIKHSGNASVGIGNNQTKTLASGVTTITHNNDGSKTFAYAFSQRFDITFSGTKIGTVSGSGTGTLNTIARASQPSCVTWPEHTQNVGDFGTEISIHMNRNSSSFTHTVRYQFGSKSGTIAENVGTGTTWVIPNSLMDLIPNSTKGSGTIYVDTYNGSTKIGTKSCGFTATVPASVKPTCKLTLEDISGVDDIYGSPVRGLSRIKITVTSTPAYSSEVASTSISADGVDYSGTTATTGYLHNKGTSRVTATVKDKRGRTGTASYDMTVLDYAAPVITALSVHRCNQDGTENDRGEYIKMTFSATVSSMSSKNTAKYQVQIKKNSDASVRVVTFTALENKYSVSNHSYIFEADGSSSYDVEMTVQDRHKKTGRKTSASTAFTLINFHPSGTSLRFGGVAEKEDTFQNDLALNQMGNTYAFQPGAFNGEKGYTLLAMITLKELNVNAPIVFTINRRGALCPMTVYVRFASSSSSTDPGLDSITYDGDNFGAFLVKSAASVWKLYVDNTSGWSNPCLQSWYTTENQMARIRVEFPNEQIAGTAPNVLGTYYRATPAKMKSIVDFVYPVGSIYLAYNHTDPAELFPGTTWARIYGAFPWFTDGDGEIGLTGGEREVTLTAKQIPQHNHGGTYTNAGTARTHAWLTSNGSAMGYDTVNAGGGEAHNNMPPYIQIAAWRRTA